LCAARIAVSVEDARADPPASVVQAVFGVPPGLVVGVGVGVGLGTAVVGTREAVRVGVAEGVGAAVVAETNGAGVTRTVSGPHPAAARKVSRKSPLRRRERPVICLN